MKIAVLGANYQYLSFYKQAVELGYDIIAFGREEDDHVCAQYAQKFYPISFTEKERIVEVCREEKIDGITSFLIESALPYLYYIARELGLKCNPISCEEYTANKYTMRERLKEKNVSIPRYEVVHNIDEVGEISFPVIVKPCDSGGSRGITLVKDSEGLSTAINRALEWSPSKAAMVEQFVEGREFSIESISFEGKHYILQITDKVTTGSPYFVELEHHQPAHISSKQWQAIEKLTIDMLDALDVKYGAGHTEIKMNAEGIPYVIEMGARMGGGFISSDLVKLSTGYDYVKGVLEVATGHFTKPVVAQKNYSGIYFLCESTKERVLPCIENPNHYEEIVYADQWGPIREIFCNSDRAGCFIYQSDKKFIV